MEIIQLLIELSLVSVSTTDSYIDIAVGQEFTVALRSDGRLFSWGYNYAGCLGNNSTTDKSVPTSVNTADSFVKIAAGSSVALALRGDGKLFAWGLNNYGQLGVGHLTNRSVPTEVVDITGNSDFKQIASTWYTSHGIRGNGTIWTWGSNDQGCLGHREDKYSPNVGQYTTSYSSPISVYDSNITSQLLGLDTAYYSVCVIDPTGRLWSWGDNTAGELGDNSRTSKYLPISVSSADSFVKVVGLSESFFAQRGSDGTIWCWGKNDYGQLGDGSTASRSVPGSYSFADSFAQIGGGALFFMGIKGSDGTVWGTGQNDSGQLGDNSLTNRLLPVSVSTADSFVKVATGSQGAFNSLIMRNDGRLFGSGYNLEGAIGDNSLTNRSRPVSVNSSDSFCEIGMGYVFSAAIRGSDGRLFTWGYNAYGQLGDGTVTRRSNPVSVSSADSFVKIACGFYHTMAIRGSDGKLFGWGDNDAGQLGDGTVTRRSYPVSVNVVGSFINVVCGRGFTLARRCDGKVFSWGSNTYGQLGNQAVLGLAIGASISYPVSVCAPQGIFSDITSSWYTTLMLRKDGKLFGCGVNDNGQLANNTTENNNGLISISTADSFSKISGGYYSLAAIRGSDGRLFSWGYNGYGQLGDNSMTNRSVPVSVSTADSFVEIVGGHYMSIAIRGDGRLFSWGFNDNGGLGDNSKTSRSVPGSVNTTDSFVQIACGFTFAIGIRGSDGRLFSWGSNSVGQLGYNSTTERSVPGSVSTTDSFVDIAIGDMGHAMALRSDGRLFSWGYNAQGQLGDNSITNRSVPGSVSSADSFAKIDCQGYTSAAIRGSDGRLFIWGYNAYGGLGDNSVTNRSFPVSISSTDSFIAVACGYGHTIAMTGKGKIFAWGDNTYGQLGTAVSSVKIPVRMTRLPG